MSNITKAQNPGELKLDISPEVSQGIYSNLAIITHSPSEMVLDFAQVLPGLTSSVVRSRIIMNPLHAKRLLNALAENVRKYEQTFGTIEEPLPAGQTVPFDILGKA